jgi:hypothetical protein
MNWKRTILACVAVVLLAGFYIHGSFDRVLYPVGLNAHECARNGLGATFCGEELEQYRAKVEGVKRELAATEQKSRQEDAAREQATNEEASQKQATEVESLKSKMAAEKAIFEREPEGSLSSDEAKDEYESDRAQLQQLDIR